MDVSTRVNVVDQVPSGMIRIVVCDKVISIAVPAPVGSERPIPCRNFEGKTAREPETMMITVEAFDVIAVGGAKMFEAAVVEPLGDDIAAIVRTIMPVPAILPEMCRDRSVFLDCPERRRGVLRRAVERALGMSSKGQE